jgi:hypothetical protein
MRRAASPESGTAFLSHAAPPRLARHRVRVVDEQIFDRIIVAARPAQTHHLPNIVDLREFAPEQHRPFPLLAVRDATPASRPR